MNAALDVEWAELRHFWHPRAVTRDERPIEGLKQRLQKTMWANAGPLRTGDKLETALADVRGLMAESADIALAPLTEFALNLQEKVELRIMLAVAESIVLPAIERRESRGAHVRLDYDDSDAVAIARTLRRDGNAWAMSAHATAAMTAS